MLGKETFTCFKGPGDPCSTHYWAKKPLHYTRHASDEALMESIPFEVFLPPWATLCDRDINDDGVYAVVFKIPDGKDGYFIVLGEGGKVITTYRKRQDKKKEMLRMLRKKQDRRRIYSTI